MKPETVNTSILLTGTAAGIFAGFCPSWFTVASPFFHEQAAKEGNIKRIRWGEVAAASLVVGMGYATAKQHNSYVPFWVAVLVSGIFIAGYEYMIMNPAQEDGRKSHGAKPAV